MTPTRPWTLVAVAAVCAVAAWLVVRSSFADLPTLPWTAVPALLLLAAAEALSGRNLRARISGRRTGKPLAPMAVARMAALAKASSLGGAAFGGLAAGFLAYTAGFLNLRMHLDHVYSSRQLEWLDFEDTHPFGEDGPFDGLSDHVPLIARFRVPDHA